MASSLMNHTNGELLWTFFENWLDEKLDANEVIVKNTDVKNNCKRTHDLPWKGVTISESVNKLLEELIEQLIDNYVNSWYKTKISDDTTFINEIRYQIRYAVAVLYLRLQKIDLSSTILFEAVPLAAIHCVRVEHLRATIDKSMSSSHLVETKILEAMPDVHFALSSRQNEVDYLRELADHLIGLIMDERCIAGHPSDSDSPFRDILTNHPRPWASHVCRHFLRELFVFSFFLPTMDLIADPDIINRVLIFLFDSDVLNCPPLSQESRQVEILHGLTDYSLNDTPDSLLQLKLSDMLRDTGQLIMFRAYLNDIHAPLNELDFLVHAGDAHGRMLNVQNDLVAMSELQYDIWELFIKYIHEGAPDRINLPIEIVCEFTEAVEKHDCELLDRCLEKAFQIVYKRMQHEYVIPFCQSECFLGNLCGPRPVGVDELFTSREYSKSTRGLLSAVEPNCSLTQFRNRFWRVVLPTAESVDPSFDHLNNVALSETNSGIEPADNITEGLGSDSPDDGTTLPTFEFVLNNGKEKTAEMQDDQLISNMPDEEVVEQQMILSNSFEIPMFDPERDMNKWNVTFHMLSHDEILLVVCHTMYVYVISVERFDVSDDIDQKSLSATAAPQKWSVIRQYNEFYILESKLIEFHGSMIKTESLPPRRFFNCKSRVYVESRREIFERFIHLLTKQRALKQSDLLYVFLSTEQRLKDSTQISDLYPWNMVKKVPGKFAREKGQNLKPFILSLLAATLIPHPNNSMESSVTSCIHPEIANQTRRILASDIYGDNCPSAQTDFSLTKSTLWTNSFYDAVLFILNRLFGVVRWPIWIIITIRHLMGSTIDAVAAVLFRRFLSRMFVDINCIRILRFIQESVFGFNSSTETDQEKMLRMELAQHLTLEYLQEQLPVCFIKLIGHKQFSQGMQTIFRILQYPRLNKQLAYVCLDIFIQKIFPIENERNLEIK
ncbi:PXA domain-containing protein [Loa loa]|uniref:PXA domain-containing protein n=1 Tax=Loa loa TaxID=7209 RepID=A0A1S0UFW4_LOALO|nr:PXA domain-containing protein [Loa loa]EJD74331.1 PXA domain-containing protein [Loa loa]